MWGSIISTIWLPTVNSGFNAVIGSWKIMEIFPPRSWRISLGESLKISLPSKMASPAATRTLGPKSPVMDKEVRLFPQPDSPTSPSVSPFPSSKLTPLTASKVP